MAAVAFDTLKLARRLESAGFSREQAAGTAEALADTLTGGIATKDDLSHAKTELTAEIARFNTELTAQIAQTKAELKGDIAELKGDIAAVRTDVAKWIIGSVLLNAATVLGVVAVVWQLARK